MCCTLVLLPRRFMCCQSKTDNCYETEREKRCPDKNVRSVQEEEVIKKRLKKSV